MSYYTQGTPYRVRIDWHWSWYRTDTFHTDVIPDLDGSTDTARCTGQDDHSPIFSGYAGTCSACWVGMCHTTAYHNQSLETYQAAIEVHNPGKEHPCCNPTVSC